MPEIRNQFLRIQLTPMQLSETIPPIEAATGLNLVLLPGEPTELVVRLENISERSLEIDLQLDGDCPLSWYQIHTEGRELLPDRRMDAALYFQIPADYFEAQQALHPRERLTINYSTDVLISYREIETGQHYLEYTKLNLFVRPHNRYLQFLPTIYREVDFINRFLKIFEQSFDPSIQALQALWAYLDPLTAPEALLPFLAYWVGWNIDASWSPSQQRRLIRHAMEIYRWRGTRRGLRLFLHLYTNLPLDDAVPCEEDKHICIEDATYKSFHLEKSRLGQDTALGHGRRYHFTVRLRLEPSTQLDESLVHQLIQQEKPAFSTYELFIEAASEAPSGVSSDSLVA
jgi:phage tail-like protein